MTSNDLAESTSPRKRELLTSLSLFAKITWSRPSWRSLVKYSSDYSNPIVDFKAELLQIATSGYEGYCVFVYYDESAMSAGRTAFYYEYAYFNYNSNFVLNLPGVKYPSTEEEMVRRYIYTKDEVIKAYSYNILYNEILTGFFVNKMNGNQGGEFDVNYHIPFKVGKNQEVIDFQFISSSNCISEISIYLVFWWTSKPLYFNDCSFCLCSFSHSVKMVCTQKETEKNILYIEFNINKG